MTQGHDGLIKINKNFIKIQADRGCAAVAFFLGGGRGRVGIKRMLCSAGYRFPRRKKSSASQQYCILIESKLCTKQYYIISIPYCNTVPYSENSIVKYHITVTHKIFETKAL